MFFPSPMYLLRRPNRHSFSTGTGFERTDGSRLDHVSDGKSLDGLVLGGASGAVGASDGLDVAAAFLVASTIKIAG